MHTLTHHARSKRSEINSNNGQAHASAPASAPANYSFVPRLFPAFFHRYELSGHNLTDQPHKLMG